MSEEIKTCGECDNWEPLFCGCGKCSENRNPDAKYGKLVPACEKFTPKKALNGNKNQIPKGFIEVTSNKETTLVSVSAIQSVCKESESFLAIIFMLGNPESGSASYLKVRESYATIIDRINEAQK